MNNIKYKKNIIKKEGTTDDSPALSHGPPLSWPDPPRLPPGLRVARMSGTGGNHAMITPKVKKATTN